MVTLRPAFLIKKAFNIGAVTIIGDAFCAIAMAKVFTKGVSCCFPFSNKIIAVR